MLDIALLKIFFTCFNKWKTQPVEAWIKLTWYFPQKLHINYCHVHNIHWRILNLFRYLEVDLSNTNMNLKTHYVLRAVVQLYPFTWRETHISEWCSKQGILCFLLFHFASLLPPLSCHLDCINTNTICCHHQKRREKAQDRRVRAELATVTEGSGCVVIRKQRMK